MPPILWTDFLLCPSCKREFNGTTLLPVTIDCGHTVCQVCLKNLFRRSAPCPYDSKDELTAAMLEYPVNTALLAVTGCHNPYSMSAQMNDSIEKAFTSEEDRASLSECIRLLQLLGQHLHPPKPASNISAGTSANHNKEMSSCAYLNSEGDVVLSRPMQKKLVSLISCQLVTQCGRDKLVRSLRSLGERCITEMILQHQHPHQLSANLWGAVRSRGCQFLGPAMQEEVIRLILTALADGSKLSRKVVVLYVVQRLHGKYPQASKTAIGHVVQLLYRASCFQVTKRTNESSLMQLKEEYCKYEPLRHEHDKQIVQIAHEAGLRIAPDQWSSLLYGDTLPFHKSRMQSIIDKLQTPQSFNKSIAELIIALSRTNDPAKLCRLEYYLQQIANLTETEGISITAAKKCLECMKIVMDALVEFIKGQCQDELNFEQIVHPKYKTMMCRDLKVKGVCPRGASCMFAHHANELERSKEGSGVDGEDEQEVGESAVTSPVKVRYNPTKSKSYVKPQAIVTPRNRHFTEQPAATPVPAPIPVQLPTQLPTQLPAQLPAGAVYYIAPAMDIPHAVLTPQQPSYYQAPVAGGIVAAGAPPSGHGIQPAVHMLSSPPQQGYAIVPPPSVLTRGRGGGGDGEMYLPAPPQYYAQHPGYHPAYYSNRHSYHSMQPAHVQDFHQLALDPMRKEEQYNMGTGRQYPHQGYVQDFGQVSYEALQSQDPQEQLYEYQNVPSTSSSQQTLATLKRRRDELLDKIQSNQKPVEIPQDAIKTEISRDRVEDLAHSLAVSMNAGSQQANLQATLVNSMLSSGDKLTSASFPASSIAASREYDRDVDVSESQWMTASVPNCAAADYDYDSLSFTKPSLGRMESREFSSTSTLAFSDCAEADDSPVWTSLSGLTSSVGSIMQDQSAPWMKMKRSHSDVEDVSSASSLAASSRAYSRSFSCIASASGGIVVPWNDGSYISKYGPISRAKGDMVNSRGEPMLSSHELDRVGGDQQELCGSAVHTQHLSTGLDTEMKAMLPIQVHSRNSSTLPVTAVTPIQRPIPCASQAQSKFKALPNYEHGFTVTSADTEGASSTTESVQLKEELKIIGQRIDEVEAQVACDELTDVERNIRRIELASNPSLPGGLARNNVAVLLPQLNYDQPQQHTVPSTVMMTAMMVILEGRRAIIEGNLYVGEPMTFSGLHSISQ